MMIRDALIFTGMVLVILSFGVITGVGTYYMGMFLMDRYDYNTWQIYTWISGVSMAIISVIAILKIVNEVYRDK